MTTLAKPVPSFRDDLKQIVTVAGCVATALSMISLGLPAIIAWVTEKLGPAIPIWKALVTTAPLTLAVAIIGTALIRGWFEGLFSLLFSAAATIVVTSGVAHLVGMPGWIDLSERWRDLPSGVLELPLAVVWMFVKNYWRIYGPQMFLSSLVVGNFLAWAWGARLLPHFTRGKSAVAAPPSTTTEPRRKQAA